VVAVDPDVGQARQPTAVPGNEIKRHLSTGRHLALMPADTEQPHQAHQRTSNSTLYRWMI
jgi:hypothetical protein